MKRLIVLIYAVFFVIGKASADVPPDYVRYIGEYIESELNGQVMGYSYAVGYKDKYVWQNVDGKAQNEADGNYGMNSNTRMIIGSNTKMFTHFAVLKALESSPLTVNSSIANLLPLHWNVHPNVQNTRIIDVMMHDVFPGNVKGTYQQVKGFIQTGNVNSSDKYSNASASIFTLILPEIIEPGYWQKFDDIYKLTFMIDYWAEYNASKKFHDYVNDEIISPLGIVAGGPEKFDVSQLAFGYTGPDDTDEGYIWDGKYTITKAAGGYVCSARDLLKLHKEVRLGDEVLAGTTKSIIFGPTNSPAMVGWNKGGYLNNGDYYYGHGGELENSYSIAINFPDSTIIVIAVNSDGYDGGSDALEDLAVDAYKDANNKLCNTNVAIQSKNQIIDEYAYAGKKLTIDGDIDLVNGDEYFFRAGEKISILPGFHAKPGAKLSTHIIDCEAPVDIGGGGGGGTLFLAPDEEELKIKSAHAKSIDLGVFKEPSEAGYNIAAFPNPFSNKTTIRYDVMTQAPVKLTIHNMLGNLVAEQNEGIKMPGNYEIIYNGSALPPGLYLYALQIGDVRITGNIIKAGQ